MAETDFWNSAINRLYYAVFYAVNALLVMNAIQTKSHSSTKSQFSMHFVKTGKFDKKYGRLLAKLFDWRQKGDYENIFDYDSNSVRPLFEPVKEMINLITMKLHTYLIFNNQVRSSEILILLKKYSCINNRCTQSIYQFITPPSPLASNPEGMERYEIALKNDNRD